MKTFFFLFAFSLGSCITSFAHDKKETKATVLTYNDGKEEGFSQNKLSTTCATYSTQITGDDFTITVSCTACVEGTTQVAITAASLCASKKKNQLMKALVP